MLASAAGPRLPRRLHDTAVFSAFRTEAERAGAVKREDAGIPRMARGGRQAAATLAAVPRIRRRRRCLTGICQVRHAGHTAWLLTRPPGTQRRSDTRIVPRVPPVGEITCTCTLECLRAAAHCSSSASQVSTHTPHSMASKAAANKMIAGHEGE